MPRKTTKRTGAGRRRSETLAEFFKRIARSAKLRRDVDRDFQAVIDASALSSRDKKVLQSGCQREIVNALVRGRIGATYTTVVNMPGFHVGCEHPECKAFYESLRP
jgi:hypothetical protein